MRTLFIITVACAICLAETYQTISTPKGTARVAINPGQNLTSQVVLQNINQYLAQLRTILVRNPQCAQQILNIIIQIENLIVLLPSDNTTPIPVDTIRPMTDEMFARFIEQLKDEIFSENMIAFLRKTARKNWFTVEQAGEIIDAFTYSDDKLTAVQILKPRLIDPENAFILKEKFTFAVDQEEFMEIMFGE